MTTGMDWQDRVGRTWAEMYPATDRSFAGLTEQLLSRIAALPGQAVLDIGCGAGELSLAVARARPGARVVGLDCSADLIEAARQRGGKRFGLQFELGDAANWRESAFAPDLLVSRHGVMFFEDPATAFAHLRGSSAPGARLAFSCFRSIHENAWAAGLAKLFDLPPGEPLAPGPFAFADPQRVEAILKAGGWEAVAFEPIDFAYIAGAGPDPVADAVHYFSRIGPAAPALSALKGEAGTRKLDELARWVAEHRSGNLVAFAGAAWIVTARA
jgi:SAM-dependent methyltransferase